MKDDVKKYNLSLLHVPVWVEKAQHQNSTMFVFVPKQVNKNRQKEQGQTTNDQRAKRPNERRLKWYQQISE